MNWVKIDRSENKEGTTITYAAEGTKGALVVQSRKRAIDHAGRPGFWMHTTYVALFKGVKIAEKSSLGDAKQYAEDFWRTSSHG